MLNSIIHSSNNDSDQLNQPRALNAISIKVISWNHLASCKQLLRNVAALTDCSGEQADKSLKGLIKNKDLVILQEAYLDSHMINLLSDYPSIYSWDMAVSYFADKENKVPTGVLTASSAKALDTLYQKNYESLFPTPKVILFSVYPLKDHKNALYKEKLLVVNIHGILFSRRSLYQQLQAMAEIIAQHEGPVLLAGDFNTMTLTTYSILQKITTQLGLKEVKFSEVEDKRVKSIMGYYYDHIFYKKLQLLNKNTLDLKATEYGKVSDHNPIISEFSYSPILE